MKKEEKKNKGKRREREKEGEHEKKKKYEKFRTYFLFAISAAKYFLKVNVLRICGLDLIGLTEFL